ncbi:MAG: FtsX-like permease family protein [Eubacterium sp.]|nr:FtsX-like permease family protein [Eubacterium sp.]
MILSILKKDLKREKTMNTVLFLFIILSTILVASGINNIVSVTNGLDFFLDKAGIGEYVYETLSGDTKFEEKLKTAKYVESYKKESMSVLAKKDIVLEGKRKVDSEVDVCKLSEGSLTYFDSENRVMNHVEPGHAWINVNMKNSCDLKKGDKIKVLIGDKEKEFIVDGMLKDAILGSTFQGMPRFFLNKTDYAEIEKGGFIKNDYFFPVFSDVEKAQKELGDVEDYGVFCLSRNVIKTTYMLDMVIALILMVVSICLLIISIIVMRFSLGISIQNEYREIGVMKGIGIDQRKIRTLYMVKYVTLGLVGAIIGLFVSVPVGKLMMGTMSESMYLGSDNPIVLNIIGAGIIFLIICFFAYFTTRKVNKMTVVDAIRNGESGERFKKKGGLRLTNSHANNSIYLALNDVISSPRRYLTVFLAFFICAIVSFMVTNFTSTMDSSSCIELLNNPGDLYVSVEDNELVKSCRTDKFYVNMDRVHSKIKEKLSANGMSGKVSRSIYCASKVELGEKKLVTMATKTVGDTGDRIKVESGSLAENPNEVAITSLVANELEAKIGDTVKVKIGDKVENKMVSGIFQTMNNQGNLLMLSDNHEIAAEYVDGYNTAVIQFDDNPSDEEIARRKAILKKACKSDGFKIRNAREECIDTMNSLEPTRSATNVVVGIVCVIVGLVTVFMERSFLSSDKKQIALMKAIGFRDDSVIGWQVVRFVVVLGSAVVLGYAISRPVTDFCIQKVFATMGASHVEPVFSVRGNAGIALIMACVAVVFAWVTSLYSKQTVARDTASIE